MKGKSNKNDFKTTDGYPVLEGHYYMLVDGSKVILEYVARGKDSKIFYVVTPIFEGEAIDISPTHGEIHLPYEHQGDPVLVEKIFLKEPVKMLDEDYKNKYNKYEALQNSIMNLKKDITDQLSIKLEIQAEVSKVIDRLKHRENEWREKVQDLSDIRYQIEQAEKTLVKLQDQISDLKNGEEYTTVSKTELGRLRRSEFKLQCLENNGVDNWSFYEDALTDYRVRY